MLAEKHPDLVSGLVLASGYYCPTARADVVGMSTPAIPVIGDAIRYTISPPLSRLLWPLILRKLFGPQRTPQKFDGFPNEMAIRPSQIRASAAESALMIPGAFVAQGSYAKFTMPVAIIVGAEDRLVNTDKQSARLHDDIAKSSFHLVGGAGHMVHQTATDAVMSAMASVSHVVSKPQERRGNSTA